MGPDYLVGDERRCTWHHAQSLLLSGVTFAGIDKESRAFPRRLRVSDEGASASVTQRLSPWTQMGKRPGPVSPRSVSFLSCFATSPSELVANSSTASTAPQDASSGYPSKTPYIDVDPESCSRVGLKA